MNSGSPRRLIGIAILLSSLMLLVWGFWRYGREIRSVYSLEVAPVNEDRPDESVGSTIVSTVESDSTTQELSIMEDRLLVLESPTRIRTGDSDQVILSLLAADDRKQASSAEFEGHAQINQTTNLQDVYDTHNIVVEARLDLAGMEFTPGGEIAEPLRPNVPVKFIWSVKPEEPGAYRGTIWVHLRFIPLDGGDPTRQALTAQIIDVDAVNLLGLGGKSARVIGALGVVVGVILIMDKIIGWLRRFLESLSGRSNPGDGWD